MSVSLRGPARLRAVLTLVVLAMVAAAAGLPPAPVDAAQRPAAEGEFVLTVLHNNDGESALLNAGEGLEDFGGIHRFASRVAELDGRATSTKGGVARGALVVSSGDNYLAGPEFNASLEDGIPFYDAMGLSLVGYDAMAIGNHEFDFGPDTFRDFVASFYRNDIDGATAPPFVSANLAFKAHDPLYRMVRQGRIANKTIVRVAGERVGVIGLTTPTLPQVSSPSPVGVRDALTEITQQQVGELQDKGVDKIVLISHLQNIDEEVALVGTVTGVDVVVGGGGGELLANPGDQLVPGEEICDEPSEEVVCAAGPYPIVAQDADGSDVPVVTTNGNYKYVGRLTVTFDDSGNVIEVGGTSGPKIVSRQRAGEPDSALRQQIRREVLQPVQASVQDLQENVIGATEVGLDGLRSNVRTQETNVGNLLTDGYLHAARLRAGEFGLPEPDVAITNGGGIRNDSVIAEGATPANPLPVTEFNTFDIAPFSNFVAVVPDVSRELLKALLEHGYAAVENEGGQFAQIGGMSVEYDSSAAVGSRVRTVTLDDDTPIVTAGAVVPGDPVTLATIDFLAQGGDGYPFGGADFTPIGVSYQQSLLEFITDPVADGGLGGDITAAQYPEGGEGRITDVAP